MRKEVRFAIRNPTTPPTSIRTFFAMQDAVHRSKKGGTPCPRYSVGALSLGVLHARLLPRLEGNPHTQHVRREMADTEAEKAAEAAPSSAVDSLLLRYVFLVLCVQVEGGVFGVVLPVARSQHLGLTLVWLCMAFCNLFGAGQCIAYCCSTFLRCVRSSERSATPGHTYIVYTAVRSRAVHSTT